MVGSKEIRQWLSWLGSLEKQTEGNAFYNHWHNDCLEAPCCFRCFLHTISFNPNKEITGTTLHTHFPDNEPEAQLACAFYCPFPYGPLGGLAFMPGS